MCAQTIKTYWLGADKVRGSFILWHSIDDWLQIVSDRIQLRAADLCWNRRSLCNCENRTLAIFAYTFTHSLLLYSFPAFRYIWFLQLCHKIRWFVVFLVCKIIYVRKRTNNKKKKELFMCKQIEKCKVTSWFQEKEPKYNNSNVQYCWVIMCNFDTFRVPNKKMFTF